MLTSIDVKFILDIACLLASLRDKSRGGCRNFDWEGPKLWFRKDCWTLFVATCSSISQYWSRLVWEILLCEQRRTDHFLISLEFSLVAKCNAIFIKKISQLKSDIRSGGGQMADVICRVVFLPIKFTNSPSEMFIAVLLSQPKQLNLVPRSSRLIVHDQ